MSLCLPCKEKRPPNNRSYVPERRGVCRYKKRCKGNGQTSAPRNIVCFRCSAHYGVCQLCGGTIAPSTPARH